MRADAVDRGLGEELMYLTVEPSGPPDLGLFDSLAEMIEELSDYFSIPTPRS